MIIICKRTFRHKYVYYVVFESQNEKNTFEITRHTPLNSRLKLDDLRDDLMEELKVSNGIIINVTRLN